MKMEQCSETSAYKFQTPGNHPKESIQHSVHGESLKSSIKYLTAQQVFRSSSVPEICVLSIGTGGVRSAKKMERAAFLKPPQLIDRSWA